MNKDILIPAKSDLSIVWINFYEVLKKRFGKENANSLFISIWKQNGDINLLDNQTFANFLIENKIDLSNKIYASQDKMVGSSTGGGLLVAMVLFGVIVLPFIFAFQKILFQFNIKDAMNFSTSNAKESVKVVEAMTSPKLGKIFNK